MPKGDEARLVRHVLTRGHTPSFTGCGRIGEWRRVSGPRLRFTVLGQGEGDDVVRVVQRLAAFLARLSITKHLGPLTPAASRPTLAAPLLTLLCKPLGAGIHNALVRMTCCPVQTASKE